MSVRAEHLTVTFPLCLASCIQPFLYHSSTDRHLNWFRIFAIFNNPAKNMRYKCFVEIFSSCSIILHSHQQCTKVPLSTTLPDIFLKIAILRSVRGIPHCGLNCISLMIIDLSISSYTLFVFLSGMSIKSCSAWWGSSGSKDTCHSKPDDLEFHPWDPRDGSWESHSFKLFDTHTQINKYVIKYCKK